MKTSMLPLRLPLLALLCLALATAATADSLQLGSAISPALAPSASANGDSFAPVLSADGRYVLFANAADNLVVNTNGKAFPLRVPPVLNVFVHDLLGGTNSLVSINTNGTAGGNGNSTPVSISTNGQFVLFASAASDLVARDTNSAPDVFVRDLVNRTTTLVSVGTNGWSGLGYAPGLNNSVWPNSRNPVATPDGQIVAFVSAANNLVAGDSNRISDVFVRDLQTGVTELISVGARTNSSSSYVSDFNLSDTPAISDDGRYVAFYSSATNLIPGETRASEIYVRDRQTGTTIFASTNARTLYQSVTGTTTNAASCNLRLSADGNYVAFLTVTNSPTFAYARGIILRYNLTTGLTDLIHTNAFTPYTAYATAFEKIGNLSMSPDGRFVAFVANVTGFSGTNTAIYLWDALTGTNTLISANTNNALPATGFCDWPSVSADGQFVAFLSSTPGLVTNALTGEYHLYRRDVLAGSTRLLDVNLIQRGAGVDVSSAPQLSTDGSRIAFESAASDLVADDRNRESDIFLRDATTQTTTLISARHPSLPSATPNGFLAYAQQPLDDNGRFITFSSHADNLVATDTNGLPDVFVRDLFTASNRLVSVATGGAAGNGTSLDPVLSGNGRFVAFTSFASNFFAGDNNDRPDVFVRDLQLNTTALVSVNTAGTGPGNGDSYSPTINADGRYVLFRSKASNLAAGATGSTENLFLRDRQSGLTYGLTGTAGVSNAVMTPDGRYVAFVTTSSNTAIRLWDSLLAAPVATNVTASAIQSLAISPDGNRLAYFNSAGLSGWDRAANSNWVVTAGYAGNSAGLRFSADSRWLTYAKSTTAIAILTNQVWLYDFVAKSNRLVSHTFSSMTTAANDNSDSPDLSADGRFVIYHSASTNLVAIDTNRVPDIFLFDAKTGTNVLLSAVGKGVPSANNRSFAPLFSGNGHTLIFRTWAADLATNDFNHFNDVLAYEFLYVVMTATNGNRIVTWPALPGQTFRVEYKNALTDALWQTNPAPITLTGNRATLTDPSPAPDHRFYHVVRQN